MARLVVTLGLAAVLPFLSVTLHRDRGVSAALVGLIWTTAGLSGAAMQWVAGEIADRVGRRPLLLGAMLLRTANLALLGYEILHRGSIGAIAGLVVLNAMLRAFFDPVASAMVADLAGGEHRIAAFSLQRIGRQHRLGVRHDGAGGDARVPHLVRTRLLRQRRHHGGRGGRGVGHQRDARFPPRDRPARAAPVARTCASTWSDVHLRRFLLATFFFFLLQVQLYAPLSIYAASHLHLSLAQVSHLYSLNGWIVVVLQVPAFYVIRRLGTHRVLVLGALMYAVAYGLCGPPPTKATCSCASPP